MAADAGQPSPTIVRDEPARPTHASPSASESDGSPASLAAARKFGDEDDANLVYFQQLRELTADSWLAEYA